MTREPVVCVCVCVCVRARARVLRACVRACVSVPASLCVRVGGCGWVALCVKVPAKYPYRAFSKPAVGAELSLQARILKSNLYSLFV